MIGAQAGTAAGRSYMRLALGLAALWIVLDQLSKWWILERVMQPPQVIPVTPFFNLVLAWNRGVSFSMLTHDAEIMPYALSALAAVIVVVLLRWLRRTDRVFPALCIGLVIGGAVGNIVDRLRFGAVVDFLDFHVRGYHWPAFNVADVGISVGVCLLVLDSLFARPERR